MSIAERLSLRQILALQHPLRDVVDDVMVGKIQRAHASLWISEGAWKTVLEVRQLVSGDWFWIAGISRRGDEPNALLPRSQWEPPWIAQAQRLALEMLDGVGRDAFEIDTVVPADQLGRMFTFQRMAALTETEVTLIASGQGRAST